MTPAALVLDGLLLNVAQLPHVPAAEGEQRKSADRQVAVGPHDVGHVDMDLFLDDGDVAAQLGGSIT